MDALSELKTQLLHLQESDRMELANFLMESVEALDGFAGGNLEAVLARRTAELKSGASVGIPQEKVFQEIERKHS